MNISTQYSVIPAPGLPVIPAVGLLVIPAVGLPVIPAVEPESVCYATGQFPVSIDSCLRRNDELNNCSLVTLYSKPTIVTPSPGLPVLPVPRLPVIPAVEPESDDSDSLQDSRFRGNDVFSSGIDAPVLRVDAPTGALL